MSSTNSGSIYLSCLVVKNKYFDREVELSLCRAASGTFDPDAQTQNEHVSKCTPYLV